MAWCRCLTTKLSDRRWEKVNNMTNDSMIPATAEPSAKRRFAGARGYAAGPVYSKKPEVAAIELIDGAYDIIELWRADSPAQEAWRKAWLKKAKELGANPSW